MKLGPPYCPHCGYVMKADEAKATYTCQRSRDGEGTCVTTISKEEIVRNADRDPATI